MPTTTKTLRAAVKTAVKPTGDKGGGPGGKPTTNPASRPPKADLAARTAKIDASNKTYQAGSASAQDKSRAAAFTAYRDSVATAKAAGQPKPVKPAAGFGPKDPGTHPIRDVRQAAGLPVKPLVPKVPKASGSPVPGGPVNPMQAGQNAMHVFVHQVPAELTAQHLQSVLKSATDRISQAGIQIPKEATDAISGAMGKIPGGGQ